MLSISLALVGMIAKDAFAGCFQEALGVGTSGVRAFIRGQLSHRGQVAPDGGEAGAGEDPVAALTAELQLALAEVAEKDAQLADKDARLAEKDARLAEKDALLATLAEELDVAVKGDRQEQDQETGPKDQQHQQPAAEDAQL